MSTKNQSEQWVLSKLCCQGNISISGHGSVGDVRAFSDWFSTLYINTIIVIRHMQPELGFCLSVVSKQGAKPEFDQR